MDVDHSAGDCLKKASEVIKKCFEELIMHKIDLSGIISIKYDFRRIIQKTKSLMKKFQTKHLNVLKIQYLQKYQVLSCRSIELETTENLNLISKNNDTNFIMTYSYGRALQQSALKFWSKDINKANETQDVFNHRNGNVLL